MTIESAQVIIDHQFRGPNHSGNGGYSCGVIGQFLSGLVTVRLHQPPPLNRTLNINFSNPQTTEMLDGEVLIASATAQIGELTAPELPISALGTTEDGFFPDAEEHILPECFVCGPLRDPSDALCLYPTPVPGSSLVAYPWRPGSQFADNDGRIKTEVVWAALDCPSYFGLKRTDMLAVLGTLTVDLKERPVTDEPCVVAGWAIDQEGRKHQAGSALYRADGQLLAAARATWIQIRKDQLLSA